MTTSLSASQPSALTRQERPAKAERIRDCSRQLVWYRFPADTRGDHEPAVDALALRGLAGAAGALADKTAVCVGLGAVGGRVFQELSRLGIGRLYGIDGDRYGRDSWLTQPIRRYQDQGRSKAITQGAFGHGINPACEIWTIRGLAQDVPLWLYRSADLMIVSGDNVELSVWIGNCAQALGKDLIELAVFGEGLAAFVRRFDLSDPEAACPGCLLSAQEWGTQRARHGCDPGTMQALGQEPTRTQPMTCALAAQLGVAEAMKLLLGVERAQRLSSEELIYSMVPHRSLRTSFVRNPSCPCPHRRWRLIDWAQNPASVTLGDLMQHYARLLAEDGVAIEPGSVLQVRGELPWVSYTFCHGCGVKRAVRRFGKPGMDLGYACPCGKPLCAVPMGMRSSLPPADSEHCRDRRLHELGVRLGGAVGISYDEQWTYYFVGDGRRCLAGDGGGP